MIRALAALAALLLALPTSLRAESGTAAALTRLQQQDHALLEAGWRLARGNAPYCTGARPTIGLLLLDARSFADPGAIRAAAGIAGDIAVQAVAPASPAHEAGLRPNQPIESIDGVRVAGEAARGAKDWRRLAGLHDAIDASLADGEVTLGLAGGQEVTLAGERACPGRFEIVTGSARAVADGQRVVIGANFPGFAYEPDAFAAAVAHEYAHNLLGHRAWLDKAGRERRNIRLTEREADRLMPWLLVNAGYDPRAALRFMREWGPRHGGWIFRKRTHDGWDERAAFIAEEIERIEALGAEKADWSRLFRREIAPD